MFYENKKGDWEKYFFLTETKWAVEDLSVEFRDLKEISVAVSVRSGDEFIIGYDFITDG
jgi:hypothetical protein